MFLHSESSYKCSQAEVGVDNSKYCMEPGKKNLLLCKGYKLTLKQKEMYSSLNSGREHSIEAAEDTRLRGRNTQTVME